MNAPLWMRRSEDGKNEEYASYHKSVSKEWEDCVGAMESRRMRRMRSTLRSTNHCCTIGKSICLWCKSEDVTNEKYISFYKSLLYDWEEHLSVSNEEYSWFFVRMGCLCGCDEREARFVQQIFVARLGRPFFCETEVERCDERGVTLVSGLTTEVNCFHVRRVVCWVLHTDAGLGQCMRHRPVYIGS